MVFFFQAEDGIRDDLVTGVQTCALPISAALREKPRSPVAEITPGWFGGWFIRNFGEPSPNSKRASAPGKIRPGPRTGLSVLDRFLSGNQACRALIPPPSPTPLNTIPL